MFAAYVAHDYVQELVFTYAAFKFGWYMSLVEVTVITLASFVQARCGSQELPLTPSLTELKCSLLLAVFIAVTLGTGSAAIAHVSFPVKVVMKSSKLLPTMLIRSIFMSAKYKAAQVAAAIGVCTGCAMFALADASASSSNHASATGIALLSVAVFADACVANTQETVLSRYRIPTARMVTLGPARCIALHRTAETLGFRDWLASQFQLLTLRRFCTATRRAPLCCC
jgi:adenosine 3'-phospho 5'-phosphosulfate transporter B3